MSKAPIEIRSYARQHGPDAIDTLYEVMRNPKAQSRSRVSAACALLDRGFGKPKETVSHDVTDELAQLLQMIDGRTRGLPARSTVHVSTATVANGHSGNGLH